jgi:2-polyprenyl-3-methyl-5-hydroxy-6-metoxy-1,4-benzoquinol methylase
VCDGEGQVVHDDLRDRLLDTPGLWSIRECRQCALAWLDPRPFTEDLGLLYQGSYMTHAGGATAGRLDRLVDGYLDAVYGRPGRPPSALWVRRIPLLDDLLGGAGAWLAAGHTGRVVDVGCGSGAFLARMRRRGWQVTGVEPDPAAAETARRMHGLEVVQHLTDLAGPPVDALTMHHVIEHLPAPDVTVREAMTHLAATGRLVIVTPNLRSLGRRRFGGAWVHWDPPRHLWLFSLKSLTALVERAGFVVERAWTTSRNARFVGTQAAPIARSGRAAAGSPALAARLRGLVYQLQAERRRLSDSEAGEELVVIARKPGR